MMRKTAPNYLSLVTSLHYDPVSGLFWPIKKKQGVQLNKPAGCALNGYVVIQLDGIQYYAHHLAWYYVHKNWPKMLDHKNRDRSDNRLCNLRVSTPSQNQINKLASPDRKQSQLPRGVFKCPHDELKFRAQIQVNKKQIYLGQFESVAKAQAAYKAASRIYFGEYAVTR